MDALRHVLLHLFVLQLCNTLCSAIVAIRELLSELTTVIIIIMIR